MYDLVSYLESKADTFFKKTKNLNKQDLFMRLTILINFLNLNKNFKFCFVLNEEHKIKLGKSNSKPKDNNSLYHNIFYRNSITNINHFSDQILQKVISTKNIEDINSELKHVFFLQSNRLIYQNIYKDTLIDKKKYEANFNSVEKIRDYLNNVIKKLKKVKELQDHDLGYNYFFNDLDNYNEFIFLILKSLTDNNLESDEFIIILFSKHILHKILPNDFHYNKSNIKQFSKKLKNYFNSLSSKKAEQFKEKFNTEPIFTLMNLVTIILNSGTGTGTGTATVTGTLTNITMGPNNSNFPIRLGLLDEFKIPWDKLETDKQLYQQTLHNISELLNNSKYLSIIKDIAENMTDNS